MLSETDKGTLGTRYIYIVYLNHFIISKYHYENTPIWSEQNCFRKNTDFHLKKMICFVTAGLTSTHNLCFGVRNRNTPIHPSEE